MDGLNRWIDEWTDGNIVEWINIWMIRFMERESVRINDLTDQWMRSHTGGLLNKWMEIYMMDDRQ